MLFKGHVLAPSFHLDVDELDFGVVAYEFLNSRNFSMFNTSTVPFAYKFRVPQDGQFTKKEFNFTPASGTIAAGGQVDVQLDLIATTVKAYDYCMVVDVAGVGESLKSVPVKATCVVPEVKLSVTKVPFGECFIRHPYTQFVVVQNESDHAAKYEVLPQDEHSAVIAEYTTDAPTGAVEPKSSRAIPITLICDRLGKVHLPLFIRIAGTQQPPMQATIEAMAIGPRVVASCAELSWGRIDCLKDYNQTITLHNASLVSAQFKTFIKSPRSKFKVDILEGVLAPDEKVLLTLTANLDDTLPHSDELHVVVTEGENSVVLLKARGVGTTMHCAEDISVLEFGHVFTSTTCERTFLLENKGRRVQSLQWVNATLKEKEAAERKRVRASPLARNLRPPVTMPPLLLAAFPPVVSPPCVCRSRRKAKRLARHPKYRPRWRPCLWWNQRR